MVWAKNRMVFYRDMIFGHSISPRRPSTIRLITYILPLGIDQAVVYIKKEPASAKGKQSI
jgi:hypothetical protein